MSDPLKNAGTRCPRGVSHARSDRPWRTEGGSPRALGEVGAEVSEQRRMIAFDGEVVMRQGAAQELRYGALRQQCVGADVLVGKVQRLERKDSANPVLAPSCMSA